MAAVLWLGRPRLDQLLRHLLLQAPTSASSSPKLAKAELSGASGRWRGMRAASPEREMCHAWPACLPARPDRRGTLGSGDSGSLADGTATPSGAGTHCLACQPG